MIQVTSKQYKMMTDIALKPVLLIKSTINPRNVDNMKHRVLKLLRVLRTPISFRLWYIKKVYCKQKEGWEN